jgi:DNA-binding PadR family transcriptional regulator
MIKSHLKIIVLKSLEKKAMTGYDLVKEIHSSTHHWKPSFGSIYPLLKDFHEKGLVSVKVSGRKKVYSLTTKGKQTLKDIFKTKDNIYNVTMEGLKGLESICNKEEIEFVHKLHTALRTNLMPFKEATSEMQKLAEIMIKFSESDTIFKNEKKIKEILTDTITRLKKLEEHR